MNNRENFPVESHDSPRVSRQHSGYVLKQRRKSLELSMETIAGQLHVSPRTVKALEEADIENLPPAVYIRGFLRNYAKLLGLPEADIVSGYPVEQPDTEKALYIPDIKASESKNPGSRILPALLGLTLLGGSLLWLANSFMDNSKTVTGHVESSLPTASTVEEGTQPKDSNGSTATPAEAPHSDTVTTNLTLAPDTTTAPPPAETATPAASAASAQIAVTTPPAKLNQTLVLNFAGDSWVTVIDADGKRLLHETGKSASSKSVNGPSPFTVKLGRPGNVSMQLDGKPTGPKLARNSAPIELHIGEP